MSLGEARLEHQPQRDPFKPGLLASLPAPPEKIIILRASRIGDFINATPAFQALRACFRQARIDLITLPMLFDLAARLEIFDQVIAFPGYPGLAEQFFQAERALEFFARMQAEKYDLAVQMQGSGVYANPFTLMLGARWAAGFIRPGDPPGLLDAALPFPDLHEAERNQALMAFLGVPVEPARPAYPLRPEDRAAATVLLDHLPRPWIGIHASARDATRRWPVERFLTAAVCLQTAHGGTILALGEARDEAAVSEAARAVLGQRSTSFANLCGKTSLPVTGAVLERMDVFITNDSGPAHIAYALRTPTVAIFGGGDPLRNGPVTAGPFRVLAYPIHCRPCETGVCPIALRCLDEIRVEQVVSAARDLLAQDSFGT
jgi:ADP-heptose:LPS heptosyltransferase